MYSSEKIDWSKLVSDYLSSQLRGLKMEVTFLQEKKKITTKSLGIFQKVEIFGYVMWFA